ncbi:MAG: hypothetical protein GY822_18700 [Deltaproteobacteria bacterium]|nr:hypothetical protein [Deltaproteobacteria bacterium]
MKLPFDMDAVKKLDASFFVNEVLPKVKTRFEGNAGEGSVVFQIADAGTWTLDMASLDVKEGDDDGAELTFKASQKDFSDALSGKMDLATAKEKIEAGFKGSADELKGFGYMLRLSTVSDAAFTSSGAFTSGTGEPPKQLKAPSGAIMKYKPPPVKKDKFESSEPDVNVVQNLSAPSDQVGFVAFNFASVIDAVADAL